MIKKISLAVCLTVLIVVIYSAGTALAAKVTVVITGNPSLSLTPSGDSTLAGVTLDGNDTETVGALGQLTVRDPRGTGAGWSVDASSTDFVETSASTHTIPASGFTVTAVTIDTSVGNGGVTTGAGPLNNNVRLLNSQSPNGRGIYTATPSVKLFVPAETYAGTYSATVTESLMSY